MAEYIVKYSMSKSGKTERYDKVCELVRCKDCKYMTEYYDVDGDVPYWACSEWDSGTDYDGYCHYGERKEEVEE